jgi:alanyl-tRNA synthetase
MIKISCDEIREKFLSFFEKNNHLKISGASIIPQNDPTLLFINAGMAPLKKYFTGEETPPKPDLCNIQPCIRTIDIDDIGDRHHMTSFEMLGSWSINHYFKKDAIKLAYDLLVNELKIPRENLYATVFEGSEELNMEPDHESAKYWEEVGFSKDHIVFCPPSDNFWGPTSEVGPCGPCTEVFYDTGEEYGESYHKTGVFDSKSRYIEIWNAGVFMEFYKNSQGGYEKLKYKSVDTGAGIERLAMALNGLNSIFDVDTIKPIKEEVLKQAQVLGGDLSEREQRVITDHLRTATFIMSENILPSNDGRGYIPRKLIRKCIGIVTKNKLFDYNYGQIIQKVIEQYGKFYPLMEERKAFIIDEVEKENKGFRQVLEDGFKKLESMAFKQDFVISGKDAFLLVTTYGIPFELIKEYANEKGGSIDENAYEREFQNHREISKTTGKSSDEKGLLDSLKKMTAQDAPWGGLQSTQFCGYEQLACEGHILCILDEEKHRVPHANQGDRVVIITDKSSFYAESGGQISDSGKIKGDGFLLEILDVQKNDVPIYFHLCKVERGEVRENDKAFLLVDQEKRNKIRRNHTSVHLLQAALRNLFGNTVKQAGSLVEVDKLRFDFDYDKKLTREELNKIEAIVNRSIMMNLPLVVKEMNMAEALKMGALALFEEKYGNRVRVIHMEEVSTELCGGTHVDRTGDIGVFKILSEASIGRGVRRIVATSGMFAVEYLQNQLEILDEISLKLKVSSGEVPKKVESLLKGTKGNAEKQESVHFSKEEIDQKSKIDPSGTLYLCEKLPFFSEQVREEALRVADIIGGVVCFMGMEPSGVKVVVAISKAKTKDYNANRIIQSVLKQLGGRGGGRDYLALGGGTEKNNVDKVIQEFQNHM